MSYRGISGRQTERGDLAPLKISVTCVTRVTETTKPLKPKGFRHVTQPNGWLDFGVTGLSCVTHKHPTTALKAEEIQSMERKIITLRLGRGAK